MADFGQHASIAKSRLLAMVRQLGGVNPESTQTILSAWLYARIYITAILSPLGILSLLPFTVHTPLGRAEAMLLWLMAALIILEIFAMARMRRRIHTWLPQSDLHLELSGDPEIAARIISAVPSWIAPLLVGRVPKTQLEWLRLMIRDMDWLACNQDRMFRLNWVIFMFGCIALGGGLILLIATDQPYLASMVGGGIALAFVIVASHMRKHINADELYYYLDYRLR